MVKFETVPQEKRVVIYRLGRFARVDGPGLVRLTKGMETIERYIMVRPQSVNFSVPNLFIYGTPFGYSLNIWYANDIQKAAGGDKQRLAHFAQFSDEERQRHARTIIQEAVRKSIQQFERNHPLPPQAKLGAKLAPILPNNDANDEIMADLKPRLERKLVDIGVILDTTYSINVVGLQLATQIVSGFERDRIVQQLRDQFPDLPPDLFAQLASSIQGHDQLKTEHLHINEGTGSRPVTVDYTTLADGSTERRIRFTPPGYENEVAAQQTGRQEQEEKQEEADQDANQDANQGDETAEQREGSTRPSADPKIVPMRPANVDGYRITKQDVAMLKTVPTRRSG